jgi:hypothetical protein
MQQIYAYTYSCQELGTSISQCGKAFGLPRLDARAATRSLQRLGVVQNFMWDKGIAREERSVALLIF